MNAPQANRAGLALITAGEAASEVEVVPATIRKWVQLGHLAPAGKRGRENLFRLEDVFSAERSAHRRPDRN
ncbi:helix-turn-helix domain-containing protein [Yinghuangia soli]|uniref:Helix-turn-helix domain-containing protein n=1 Tax=Yinghuangia soli TaxID=2908204 RepID=A0AA41Q350_9ACTN|nr:helix-turn-helix domain-containing protein [Yinghuangia soli]MCF2530674.1 helix-turn-helix domain-containing protein [Yinghuangia soli]